MKTKPRSFRLEHHGAAGLSILYTCACGCGSHLQISSYQHSLYGHEATPVWYHPNHAPEGETRKATPWEMLEPKGKCCIYRRKSDFELKIKDLGNDLVSVRDGDGHDHEISKAYFNYLSPRVLVQPTKGHWFKIIYRYEHSVDTFYTPFSLFNALYVFVEEVDV